MEGRSQRAILLGEQSLLVQCGDLLLSKGFEIAAVVSRNRVIEDWCAQKSVDVFNDFKELEGQFEAGSLEFVFSITNLKVLPNWLISIGKQAINFHDGPLPKYAGLNAPVWAILNDEAEHGVTWHEMTANIDEGQILAQRRFPIVVGETALSINAKCYQAGLESFGELVEGLQSGQLSPQTQDLSERSYFGLTKRPEAAGFLNWDANVSSLDRMVRALDHGTYRNPLVAAKFKLGSALYICKQAKVASQDAGPKNGEIVAISREQISIAAADGVLELSQIETLNGKPIACLKDLSSDEGVSVGDIVENLSEAQRDAITSRVEQVCRYEERWVEAYRAAEAISIPYAKRDAAAASDWKSFDLTLPANVLSNSEYQANSQAYSLALFALLLGRLNSKSYFTLAFEGQEQRDIAAFFETYLPLTVDYDDSQGFSSLVERCQNSLEKCHKYGAVGSDLWSREPALVGHGALTNYPVKLDLTGAKGLQDIGENDPSMLYLCLGKDAGRAAFLYDASKLSDQTIDNLQAQLSSIATEIINKPDSKLSELSILTASDLDNFSQWNATSEEYGRDDCLHHLIERRAEASPESVAVAFEEQSVNFTELNQNANRVARLLMEKGAKPGELVGVMMDRSIDMVLTLIAIHKIGCAYVPLDPVYPSDRLRYMIEDSGLSTLVTEAEHKSKLGELDVNMVVHDELASSIGSLSADNLDVNVSSDSLAYVIYTSGSTGKPKGVMVEHRNVVNFFVGMDHCIDTEPGVWLTVTSISFDISVLEIFWTLARGYKVVIYSEKSALGDTKPAAQTTLESGIDFSLFYWNVADEESHHLPDKYKLLIEGAKFADANGFKAVWNPERHFASFGGLFPNPSVTCAALATITENVDLRAGSCVVPLHSPIRVAEEWAVVDNLSNGRVGIAVASGWAPPDFAIKPENFSDAKNIMFESLEQVRKLWRGEKVTFPGPTGDVEVRTLPRPIQKELPHWVTTAGNVDTFRRAGEAGSNVLTHLLGQTFDEVKEKVDAYRAAWKEAGHEGEGVITLMLHTLIGEDMQQVEDLVRQPMKDYLKSAMFLVKGAAWNFPTFKKMSEETGKSLDEFFETISDEDMDDLLEFAFQRYFRTSGLFGTPESAVETVAKCLEIGVDEIACLIDYGIDTNIVMQQLPHLQKLKENCAARIKAPEAAATADADAGGYTIPELLDKHNVTHFQCTPSMATMLVNDPESQKSLSRIKHMMVGGEAMSQTLAKSLKSSIGGRLTNMYGPTETTIWSSVFDIDPAEAISIGRPISNTQIYIVDQHLNALPTGVPGELVIGGDGVVRGYHNRPELTEERFVENWQLAEGEPKRRIYRTGDLAVYAPDGRLMCLGRIDHQVKIRGYRIELGEIEALLQSHDSVRECAVILREDTVGDKRLVAYVRAQYEKHVDPDELRTYLGAQLPEFMVPAFYVELQTMPLTPNGKLDRNALPEPIQQKHQESGSFALPENEWENLVADIWQRSLGVPEVGRKDNFFDIGGHSLLVIQVLKELRENDKVAKQVQMTDLFRHTTVEALAQFIAAEETESASTEAASSRVAARKAAMNRRRRR